jgi:hypothetical protein
LWAAAGEAPAESGGACRPPRGLLNPAPGPRPSPRPPAPPTFEHLVRQPRARALRQPRRDARRRRRLCVREHRLAALLGGREVHEGGHHTLPALGGVLVLLVEKLGRLNGEALGGGVGGGGVSGGLADWRA